MTALALLVSAACGAFSDGPSVGGVDGTGSEPARAQDRPASEDGGLVLDEAYSGEGPTVAVYGDSLTVGATPHLRRLLDEGGTSFRITAVRGEGFGGGQWSAIMEPDGIIATTAEEDPVRRDVVVLALGTNDAWEELLTVEAALAGLDRIVAAVGDACIVAVEASEQSDDTRYDEDEAREINEAVRAVADRVVGFDLLASHRVDDDIHLTGEGYEVLAQAVSDEVLACIGR